MKAEVYLFGNHLGTLIETERAVAFVYAPDYLGPSPSPLVLPAGSFNPVYPRPGASLLGVFADSLPDAYGTSALDEWFRENGLNPLLITPVERLCYLGDRCFGGLSYRPDLGSTRRDLIRAITEIDISKNARLKATGDQDHLDPQFLEAASSPGGARPKIAIGIARDGTKQLVIGDWHRHIEQYAPALLKIDTSEARCYGRIEHAYLLMAAAAGITVSPHFLFEQSGKAHFVTQRFDWRDRERLHLHTVAGLLDRDFNLNVTTYQEILTLGKTLTGKIASSEEYLRRAIFNYLAANCDDHAKNHSFLMDKNGDWHPSPAYDLTPSQGPVRGGIHATHLGGEYPLKPETKDWIKLGTSVGISKGWIQATLDQVTQTIKDWPKFAEQAGIPAQRADEIVALHQNAVK